jgi:uncharacterized protein (TIGR02466 family)
MINCEYIFPTPIWSFFYNLNTDLIIKKIYDIKSSDCGRIISNVNGWQSSDFNIDQSNDLYLFDFFKFVSKNTPLFLESLGNKNKNLVIDNYWLNVNSTNSFNKVHVHGGSFLSGVLYLQTSDNCGNLIFHRNSNEQYILSSNATYSTGLCGYTSWKYTAEKNKCIIFPSWLSHEVEPNLSLEDRISIAFNLSWK